MKHLLVIRDKEHRAEVFGKLQNSIIFKLLETKEIDLLDPYKLGPDIADEVMGWIDGLSGNLLASFGAEVGSVFGHYTEDPKGDQVELKIVAIPDGLEGEQIEKGKKYHILILEEK